MPSYAHYQERENLKRDYVNNLIKRKKSIKYILLGECAPKSGNYIYKDGLGSYITAPLNAAGKDTRNKKLARIDEFMDAGFLLIDLYPFAINYNEFRKKLIANILFMRQIHLNIIKEIGSYKHTLDSNWDFCFVAPENTSSGILNYLIENEKGILLANKNVYHTLDFNNGFNDFVDKGKNVYSNYTDLDGKMMPKLARMAVRRGSTGPGSDLIKRIFAL